MIEKTELIVISGVTRGLGRAMALGFVAAGHTVVGCGRSAKEIDSLLWTLGAPHGFEVVDVSEDEAVSKWATEVLTAHGPPDRLINNAGLMNTPAPLWDVPAAEMDRLLQVNVGGTANMIRHFLPAMINRGSGVIVNFSSGWGRTTAPDVAPYCATKWAIEGLNQALAQDLPRGIATVALNPGIIDTEMLRTCWADQADGSPRPADWAAKALPYILSLGADNNGGSVTVALLSTSCPDY